MITYKKRKSCLARSITVGLDSHHYPFEKSLDSCSEICNALDNLTDKLCLKNPAKH